MAKIYETREDFKKDKLTEQAHALRTQAHQQDSLGFSMMAGSFLAGMFNSARAQTSKGLAFLETVLAIGAVVEWIQAWRTGSRAHDLELQRDRMGPTEVVLLDGDVSAKAKPAKDCKPCDAKSFAGGYKLRKHTEHAAKHEESAASHER